MRPQDNLYADSNIDGVIKERGMKLLDRIPLDPQLSELADRGELEDYKREVLLGTVARITLDFKLKGGLIES